MMGGPWPVEHIEALSEYVADRAGTHSKICALMNHRFRTNYSRNAIIGKVARLGLQPIKRVKTQAKPKAERPSPVVRTPAPANPEPPALRCVEVIPLHIPIIELTDATCHWPYGDRSPFAFCGNPVLAKDASYCGPHFALSRRER